MAVMRNLNVKCFTPSTGGVRETANLHFSTNLKLQYNVR
jgi:hypothetical protein